MRVRGQIGTVASHGRATPDVTLVGAYLDVGERDRREYDEDERRRHGEIN